MEQCMTLTTDDGTTIQVLATRCGPEGESALLRELLTQNAEPLDAITEATPSSPEPHALAGLAAYKQRLQAIRCEYVSVRLWAIDLEEQLSQARLRIAQLEIDLGGANAELQSLRSSRAWQMAAKYIAWRQSLGAWLGRLWPR